MAVTGPLGVLAKVAETVPVVPDIGVNEITFKGAAFKGAPVITEPKRIENIKKTLPADSRHFNMSCLPFNSFQYMGKLARFSIVNSKFLSTGTVVTEMLYSVRKRKSLGALLSFQKRTK